MLDAPAANWSGQEETVEAKRLAHARRKFIDIERAFPVECGRVLDAIAKVYRVEAEAEGMSAQERLECHQARSGPVMAELHEWIEEEFADRSAPIQEPFKILGPMSAVIYVSSDAPETDIVVRISEEDPSHKHFRLAEGKTRVRFQGKKPVRVEVDLWHTAIRIAKGNCLVVDIASASFPKYARNLNTGENSLTGTVHRKAKVAVHRSAEFPSFVEFSSVTGVDRQ
jgi:predicted acyl esterase